MRKRGIVAGLWLVACTESRPPAVTTVDTGPDAAPAPSASAAPPAESAPPVSSPAASGDCTEAIADATKVERRTWKTDPHELDADGDGTPECVLRSCYGSNCDVLIYRREPDGVRRIGKMKAGFVSSPFCTNEPPKGTFCRLDVGVHMIHGETMPTYWTYTGKEYVETGHGELLPGPSKYVPKHHP